MPRREESIAFAHGRDKKVAFPEQRVDPGDGVPKIRRKGKRR
jgi:hypothetical protein